MHFREEEENRGEVHACMCTQHLLKTLYCASHMKSYELPFITSKVLAGFGWLPNCYWCQKPKTSEGWFILCRDSSGTGLRGGEKQHTKPPNTVIEPSVCFPTTSAVRKQRGRQHTAPQRTPALPALPEGASRSSSKYSFTCAFFVCPTAAIHRNRANLDVRAGPRSST